MFSLDPATFPFPWTSLLEPTRLPPLGPGKPNEPMRSLLASLSPEQSFGQVKDREIALACISGLWLLHDFLDESHSISQEIHTPTGSFWHAIMHRREPDAFNSKYWWRKVGNHPVLARIGGELGVTWDPYIFVDRCEKARDTGTTEELECRRLQRLEWNLLFDWCYQSACGEVSR